MSDVEAAAKLIRDGELVALPTETVYGLGADATNERAVAKIFEAKGRPKFNPLISHVTGAEEAKRYVRWNDTAEKLAANFWPGPLTLVLPRAEASPIALLTTAGLDTVAIRAPDHPLAQALIRTAGRPIAAGEWVVLGFPGANRDPEIVVDRPDEVVIDRQANRHAAFGLGVHRCLGSNLARMELIVAIEEFLARFPDFELSAPDDVIIAAGQVRGPRRVPARILATSDAG